MVWGEGGSARVRSELVSKIDQGLGWVLLNIILL